MNKIELRKGDVICPECNGSGKVVCQMDDFKTKIIEICRICDGNKKVDWIQNLLKIPNIIDSYYLIDNKEGHQIILGYLYFNPGLNEDTKLFKHMHCLFNNEEVIKKLKENELHLIEYAFNINYFMGD